MSGLWPPQWHCREIPLTWLCLHPCPTQSLPSTDQGGNQPHASPRVLLPKGLMVKYYKQIAQYLSQFPTNKKVENQIRVYRALLGCNSFTMVYIMGLCTAHIAKLRKQNPFFLETLRHLNSSMPIRVEAERISPTPSTSPAITSGD